MPDSLEHLCIAAMPQEPENMAVPENMDIDIPEDIPDLINVPEELLTDFKPWAQSVLENQC